MLNTSLNEYQFKDMTGKVIRTGDHVKWFRSTYKIISLSSMGGRTYDLATVQQDFSLRIFEIPTYELTLI